MSKIKDIDPIEQADAERIAGQAEETLAKADEERINEIKRVAVMESITGDLPSDTESLWLITEQGLGRICMDIVLVGRALMALKDSLPHGEFLAGLKDRGIPVRTAQRMMLVARRFADRTGRLLKLSRSKLYAIAEMLDDDQVEQLEAGEDVLGLTLDEAERMTARDLRERLRKMEADVEVKEKLLAEKNQHIDDLATELERLKGGVPEVETPGVLADIEREKLDAVAGMMQLKARIMDMERRDDVGRAEWFALRAAVETLRDEVAMMLSAVYATGQEHQFAQTMASMPSDADINVAALPGAPTDIQ